MNDARPVLMPKARKDQLIIKELPDETLVYDLTSDKAHCLNAMAAKVWKNCDGETSIAEITATLSKEIGGPVDEGVVWLAVDQLERFKPTAGRANSANAFRGNEPPPTNPYSKCSCGCFAANYLNGCPDSCNGTIVCSTLSSWMWLHDGESMCHRLL